MRFRVGVGIGRASFLLPLYFLATTPLSLLCLVISVEFQFFCSSCFEYNIFVFEYKRDWANASHVVSKFIEITWLLPCWFLWKTEKEDMIASESNNQNVYSVFGFTSSSIWCTRPSVFFFLPYKDHILLIKRRLYATRSDKATNQCTLKTQHILR